MGTQQDEKPDFGGSNIGEGLKGRPDKFTPFLTPLYDENKNWQTWSAYQKLKQEWADEENLDAGLSGFINEPHAPKYDLIKVALAHHRFGWIHPFGNGNGRVVRLLTYALLIKYGFNVQAGGRVLNPTAVFCNDRDKYYSMLALVDSGSPEGQEAWCTYVLTGILDELKKVDQLTDFAYLRNKILTPALAYATQRELITAQEESILHIAAKMGVAKAGDLAEAMPNLTAAQRTYQIKKLVERKMLQPVSDGARQYTFGFSNNYLMRGVIRALSLEGFIPATLNEEKK